jgi:hypothetical protein
MHPPFLKNFSNQFVGKTMKKLFFTILLLSQSAFAEDIYDRINECEKQADRSDCLLALVRELAQQKNPIEVPSKSGYSKGTELCRVEAYKDPNQAYWGIRLYGGNSGGYQANWYQMDLDSAKALTQEWQNRNCDSRGKVTCEMLGKDQVVIISGQFVSKQRKDAAELLAELQNSICM